MKKERQCGWCGKPIWYGLFCMYDDCGEKHYEQWKKDNPQYAVKKKERGDE